MYKKISSFLKVGAVPIIFSLLFAGGVACLTGCGDDNADTPGVSSVTRIDGRVENGASYNSQIDSVKLYLYGYGQPLARTRYSGGAFTLSLPANLPQEVNELLSPIEGFFREDLGENNEGGQEFKLDFSDKKAQYVEAYVRWEDWEEYKDESEEREQSLYLAEYGRFYYGNPEREITGFLLYVDRDVTITGGVFDFNKEEGVFGGNVNLTSVSIAFKKGWNFYFESSSSSRDMANVKGSTTTPSGVSWYHQNDW